MDPRAIPYTGQGVQYSLAYADTTARDAATLSASAIGRIARVGISAPYEFYILLDDAGPSWAPVDASNATVGDNQITMAKLADLATQRIIGRTTAGTGDPEALTPAQVNTMLETITQGLHRINMPAGAWTAAGTNPATVSNVTTGATKLGTWKFSAASEQHLNASIAMPEGWNHNSALYFQVEFSYTGASTAHKIVHAMKIAATSSGDSTTPTYGAAVVINTDLLSSNPDKWHKTAISGAVTPGNSPAKADSLTFDFYRPVADANDTLDKDTEVLHVNLWYSVNASTDEF